ncbi:MAG: DsbA family protein [Phycisphaerae bacterium]
MTAGLVSLAFGGIASLLLALGRLQLIRVPGCGGESACAGAAASGWATIPGVHWPVAFLGLAYFLGAAAAWILTRGVVPAALRQLARAAAAVSLLFLLVMIFGRYLCYYCLVAHLGNLVFWAIVEQTSRSDDDAARRPLLALAAVFAASSLGLGLADWGLSAAGKDKDADGGRSAAAHSEPDTPTLPRPPGRVEDTVRPDPAALPDRPARRKRPGFTGRYLQGPEVSPIRIVVFSDYQCPICARIEEDWKAIRRNHPEVSFSIKHFPACEECNDRFKGKNMHPNACRAARAAEAAGALHGDDGFWQMHDWLFEQRGEFTNADLQKHVQRLGWETSAFFSMMDSRETRERVRADIEEAIGLGLHATPMVFINGTELRGIGAQHPLRRAVTALLGERLDPRTAESDHPPSAPERYLSLWRAEEPRSLPPDTHVQWLGPQSAAVRVVLWGDYQEPATAETDAAIRRLVTARTDARYAFRHFPINKACNAVASNTVYLFSCLASRAAEAARIEGDAAAYWKLHAWLMENRPRVGEETIRKAASRFGLNAETLFQAVGSREVADAIDEDVRAAVDVGLKRTPWLFVNGRRVPSYHGDGEKILKLIFDAAAESPEASQQETPG